MGTLHSIKFIAAVALRLIAAALAPHYAIMRSAGVTRLRTPTGLHQQ